MSLKVGELYAVMTMDKGPFESSLKSVGKTLQSASKAMVAALAVVAAAVIAISAAAAKMVTGYDAAVDAIRSGTGATGKALDDLVASFDLVAKRVPDDLVTVGKTIADLNTRTGATGAVLEDLAVNILDFSRLTKTDLNENVRNATRLFGDWSIKTGDQAGTLDKVFRASQATGIGVSDLMQKVVDFGSPMRLLGFSFDESIALLSKWEKEGVNTETALSGLKYGVKTLAKEGIDAADMGTVLQEKIAAIGASADPVGESIKLFGLRAGPDLAAAILEGRFATEDLVNTIVNGTDSIAKATADTQDAGEQMGKVFNTLSVAVGAALLPAFNALGDWISANMPAIQATIEAAVATIVGAIQWLSENVLPTLVAAFDTVRTTIDQIVQAVLPPLVEAFNWVTDGGTNMTPVLAGIATVIAIAVIPAVVALVTTLGPLILAVGAVIAVVAVLVKAWQSDWGGIRTTLTKAWEAIRPVFETVVAWLGKTIPQVINALIPVVQTVFGIIGTVIDATVKGIGLAFDILRVGIDVIGTAFSNLQKGIKAVWDGIGGIIKGAINIVIGTINGFIRAINSIQIHIPEVGVGPVHTPAFDWNGVNLGQIPYLAAGTNWFKGGLAMVGEQGPELAYLPQGTGITAHSKLGGDGGMGGGGGPLIGEQHIYGIQPDEVERQTKRAIRRAALEWQLEGHA